MTLGIIIILVFIVMLLMIYNYSVHKKIDTFTNLNQRVTSLNVLQEFMNTLGENTTIKEKLESINDILINKYAIKYSTIVVFDGAEYQIKASNVEQKHWEALKNLQSDPVFADSIKTAVPKYVTVENENEKLPYQKMEFGRAKCAIFFPLYVDNVYIGYWIIEGSMPHEFDKTDTTILEVVRNNIVTILKTVETQATIENIVRDDLYSGLKSAEYLYGEGKKTIDKYTTSAICIFKITNLPSINTQISRKTGDSVITQVATFVKNSLGKDYIFVRFMGPKFAIVFSGVDVNGVKNFMQEMKNKIENMRIPAADDYYSFEEEKEIDSNPNEVQNNDEDMQLSIEDNSEEEIAVNPRLRVAISTYYKGTSLDGTLKKVEEYIDLSDENTINVL